MRWNVSEPFSVNVSSGDASGCRSAKAAARWFTQQKRSPASGDWLPGLNHPSSMASPQWSQVIGSVIGASPWFGGSLISGLGHGGGKELGQGQTVTVAVVLGISSMSRLGQSQFSEQSGVGRVGVHGGGHGLQVEQLGLVLGVELFAPIPAEVGDDLVGGGQVATSDGVRLLVRVGVDAGVGPVATDR
jgi:hypothetical protein